MIRGRRRLGNNFSKTVTFAITESQKNEIKRLSKLSGKSVSAFVRDLVIWNITKNKETGERNMP